MVLIEPTLTFSNNLALVVLLNDDENVPVGSPFVESLENCPHVIEELDVRNNNLLGLGVVNVESNLHSVFLSFFISIYIISRFLILSTLF